MSVGIKITDHRRRHPITKKPLFVQPEDSGSDAATYLNVQSRELCCILVMVDAHDSKSLYSHVFDEYYKAAEKLPMEGLAASQYGPVLKPFDLTYPQDLSSAWKTLGRGGACKNAICFATCAHA